MTKELYQQLEKQRKDFYAGNGSVIEGLDYSTRDRLKMIEFYYNGQYLESKKDYKGEDLPFYNTTKFRVKLTAAKTDISTKDVQVSTANPDRADRGWIYAHEVKSWMNEVRFGKFLNEMNFFARKYGTVFVKKIEKNGKLDIQVVNIHNLSFDPEVFSEYTPIFEEHNLTLAELHDKKDVWDNVDKVIDIVEQSKNSGKPIEIIEATGYMKYDGSYQFKHIIYYPGGDGIELFNETLQKHIYKKFDHETVPNRSLGVGVVEDCEQSQRWTNDLIQRQKGMIDSTSKVYFKTDDHTMGNNVLTELENGDVIKVEEGKTFAQVNSVPTSLPSISELLRQWDTQAERVIGTYGPISGETMPSGTPYRTVAMLQNAGSDLFKVKMEDMDFFLQELFADWIFPYLSKKLTKKHVLDSEFSQEELELIDDSFATEYATQKIADKIFEGDIVTQEDYESLYAEARNEIAKGETRRFLDIPDNYFEDIRPKLTLVISGENRNKGVMLETLGKIMSDIASNPGILDNPVTAKLFSRIVEVSDVGIPASEFIKAANAMRQQTVQMAAQETKVPQQEMQQMMQ